MRHAKDFNELKRLYSEQLEIILAAKDEHPAMLVSMTVNELRRWYDSELSRLCKDRQNVEQILGLDKNSETEEFIYDSGPLKDKPQSEEEWIYDSGPLKVSK